MTQWLNGAVIFLCVFLSVNCIAQPKPEFSQAIIDVGEIFEGPDYDITWYFKNTGDAPLQIERVKSSGSILAGDTPANTVVAGAEGKITAKLYTTGWGGNPFNKSLLVQTNAGKDVLLIVKGYIREVPADASLKPKIATTSFDNKTNVIAQQDNKSYNIQPGDILFQDLDCGAACDAIEAVTEGANGMDFSHCGIVVQMDNDMMVVEAYGAVKVTPVDSFFARTKDGTDKPKILIGRLKDERSMLADESAELAKKYVGKEYDDAFDMKNDSYYCSELLYECFKEANKGKPFFPLNDMTFKTPGTNSIMPFWEDYFKKLDKPVPEGKPGINPGAMSRSDKLVLIVPERL